MTTTQQKLAEIIANALSYKVADNPDGSETWRGLSDNDAYTIAKAITDSGLVPVWRPIEECPDNIPVFGADFSPTGDGAADGGVCIKCGDEYIARMGYTHFMPLPQPPEEE